MISKRFTPSSPSRQYSLSDIPVLAAGVRNRDRKLLARALTLVESQHPEHEQLALALMDELDKDHRAARSFAITGPPGAGKSTLIESMGKCAIAEGKRVAVLTIDPSSELTGGSILGDKTRMPELSRSENAFVRPSPSRGQLGGIHHTTFFVKRICEAAGYDIIFIETVGVGQSEVTVRHLVDMNIVLVQPGSGDELQGIKMGLNEWADFFIVNKADGDHVALAREAKSNILSAATMSMKKGGKPPVVLHSFQQDNLRRACWKALNERYDDLFDQQLIAERRKKQLSYWFALQTRRIFIQLMERDEELMAQKHKLHDKFEQSELELSSALKEFYKIVSTTYGK